MKIKFIKEYRACYKFRKSFETYNPYKSGDIDDMPDVEAQWLIDNGFAEKVEEQWPVFGDQHWYVDGDGDIMSNRWTCDSFDDRLKAIGNVFKTKELAQAYLDYLKAVETVRHDDGFMKQSRKIDYSPCGYGVYRGYDKSAIVEPSDMATTAGEFYFDTYEHAKASIETHRDEWQTILDYDWSKE